MKISVNWMQHYAGNVKIMPKGGIDELVNRIGAQLGAVEEVIDLGKKYQGVVIAKVVSCVPHPNADKLHICKIDDGGVVKGVKRDKNGYVQVVCGAPNVREGLLVAWLPPGATVPSSFDKDPFVLEAREIRGEVSNGMLASPHELTISDDHNGILEVDEPANPGEDFAKAYALDDYVIDIENKMFTHRPDLFGQLGVAREIAGITHQQFVSPDWYKTIPKIKAQDELELSVKNELPELVPRFMAVALKDVEVKPSPIWLQTYLNRVGVRPINNVVDITNYFMMLTAQPLHAYDADKLRGQSQKQQALSLETRKSRKGEKIKLLGGKEVTFDDDSVILITSNDTPVGIGGVMGGADTEVDATTKNIVLECANFDMYSIRRTSMKYGLFTDAVTRFNKGQNPLQTDVVLAHATTDMMRLAGVKIASQVIDKKGDVRNPIAVHVRADFINARLGLKLDAKEMSQLLTNVEFDVRINGPTLVATPPFWRTDIEIPEDVVEEVGRLYGYDHLPLVLPKRVLTPAKQDDLLVFKQRVREILAKAGANEVLTYSFVHGNLLDSVGQDHKLAYELSNALSPDLQYYRLSMTPSLLDKVHPNIKAGFDEFAIFELGKGHNKAQMDEIEKTLPKEFQMLALVFAASNKKTSKYAGAPYYAAWHYLDYLAHELGQTFTYTPIKKEENYQVSKPFDYKRSAAVWYDGKPLGMVGEYRSSVAKALKLPALAAGFEISIEQLMASAKNQRQYLKLPRFPKVQQDISLKVPADLPFADVFTFVQENLNAPENTQSALTPIDIYQGKDKKTKNITLRLTIASYEKTMTDSEVNKLLDEAATKTKTQFGAERI